MPQLRWLVIVVSFFIVSGLRADEWPVARGPSREPLPYRHDPATLKTLPKEFLEDSTACVLYAGTTYLVEPDGTVESISHELTRLNSRKGVDRLGEFRSVIYDPSFEKLTLNEARVIKADGKIVPIEPKHVQLRDVATDFQVYDQDKQLVISFPNLEVGDTYEVKWTIRGRNREFDGNLVARYRFGDDQLPVARDELRVRIPKGKTLKHASINGKVDLVVTDTDTEKLFHWSVTNRPPLPRDDDHPSREELRLQIAVSTFPTWEAVGQWKHKLRKDCWECTPEIRKVVAEVTRGKETQIDKAKALTYWVRRQVRYLSRGPAGLGYTPHPPQQVLKNLYGDCKDQAQLLAVMLKEIGLPVWLVTLGTLDDGHVQPDVPSPWGTHAILLTQIDGKEHWIDTTVALAAWDFLPRSDRDRQVYVTKDAELKLMRTPAFTYKDYRIEQVTHMTVHADGTSQCKREATHHHSAGWMRRDRLLDVAPGERRRFVTAELLDANSKSKLLALEVDDKHLLDFDKPVRTQLVFEIPRHFVGEGALREASLTDSPVYTWFLGYNLDPERRLPFVLPTQFESLHRYVVQLPLAYRLENVPENKTVKSPWGFFELKVVTDPKDARRLELHMHMRLEKTRVEKKEFAAFTHFQDDVAKAYRVWLTVRPTTSLADAKGLENHLKNQKEGDAQTAKILAKLFLDNDRAEDAQRVLQQASKLAPGDAVLWELRVQASANSAEEERLYRAMVKQFPHDPKYAVALGAVCVRREDFSEAAKILTPLTTHTIAAVRGAAHYQLARNAFRQKNFTQAQKHLQQALFTDSASLATMDAMHFKARVHEKLGQFKEAIATLHAALEADPSEREALEYITRLHLQTGQKDAALDYLRRYTIAAGKDLSSVVRAADMHLQLGRHEDAFELASGARELGFQAKAQRVLGLVHFAKGEYPQAVFHLDRCDLDAKALAGLIHAHVRLGDLDAAQRRAETIRKFESSSELAALEKDLASLLARRNKLLTQWDPPKDLHAAATRVVNRYLSAERGLAERWPGAQIEKLVADAANESIEYGPILAQRGWLLLERGQLRKALADAEAALKLQPGDARAHLVRGRVGLEQTNVPAALKDLAKATELSDRQDATVLHWFAAALHESGRTKEALETQRLALLLRPGDAELQEQLRRLETRQGKEATGGAR